MGAARYRDLNSDLPVCISQVPSHIQMVTSLVAVQKQLTVVPTSAMHQSPIENPFTFFPISTIEPMALWPGMSCKKDGLLKHTI